MKTLLTRIFLAVAVALSIGLSASPAFAATNPFGGVDCSKARDSTVCQTPSGGDPLNGTNGILHKVIQLIAIFAGAVAVLIIILSGIRYITSNGDAEKVSKAKQSLIYAAVGLIVIIAGRAIINLVLSRI